MKLIRLLLLTLVAFSFTSPNELKLEYVFKPGDEYVWTQDTKQNIKQSIMGMEQITDNAYFWEAQIKVIELNKTGAKLETKFSKLKLHIKGIIGETIMDSEGPQEKTENKVMKASLNKPFYILLNKRGEIEDIQNAENLWSGLKETGLDESAQAGVKQSLEQLLGKASLKGSFEQAFVSYPDKKIKQGEKWTMKAGAPMNFPIAVENTWNLESINANDAYLTADGVYTTTDKTQRISLPGGLKATADLTGRQAMKSNVDIKSGWPSKLSVLSEMKGKMTLLAGGMIPEDMDIPMEIVSETSFVIKKK